MSRTRLLVLALCVACLGGAGGVLTWVLWPEPPPATAGELFAEVLKTGLAGPSEENVDEWIDSVAAVAKRLPPHEFEKVAEAVFSNPQLRERIQDAFMRLTPEQQAKLRDLIPDAQKMRLATEATLKIVQLLKDKPAWARRFAVRQMYALHKRQRHSGRQPKMTKEEIARLHAKSTPRQRASLIRAMRDMRTMLEDAGVHD